MKIFKKSENTGSLRDLVHSYGADAGFIYEGLVIDLAVQVKRLMDKEGVNKKELAERMGVTTSYLTRIFSGQNLTLRNIAKIFAALEIEPVITITGWKYHHKERDKSQERHL